MAGDGSGLREALLAAEALLEGHFLLSSGKHSDRYVQCARLMQYPGPASEACAALADKWRDDSVEVVVGPALGAVTVGYETARQLEAKSVWVERVDGEFQMRRGWSVEPGDRVLVVEDVVTTGGSSKEAIALIRSMGALVIGVGSLVDRTGGESPFDVAYRSVLPVDANAWEADECPLCREGSTAVKPGSRGT